MQDIAPGSHDASPAHLTAAGAFIFFSADDGTTGQELWALPASWVPEEPLDPTPSPRPPLDPTPTPQPPNPAQTPQPPLNPTPTPQPPTPRPPTPQPAAAPPVYLPLVQR